MIKKAIEYIVGLGNTRIEQVGEQTYTTQPIHQVKENLTSTLRVNTLTGLIDYIQSNFDGERKLMVHVESPTEVTVFDTLNRDKNRNVFVKAVALLPEFRYERFYDSESFIINLQAGFVEADDRKIVLQVAGSVTEENVRNTSDDGVTQMVQVRTGIQQKTPAEVPNPVTLRPFRTFVEVEQPSSDFIFRMQQGPKMALFEADGGAWKNQAITNVANFLDDSLQKEIAAGQVVIIA